MRTDLRRVIHRIAAASLCLYVLSLMAWFVARYVVGDAVLPVLVLSYLGVWLFSPLLVFVPWAIVTERRLAVPLVVPVAMLVGFYGPSPTAHIEAQHEPIDPITILSFNLLSDNADTASITDVLLSSQAEVLALQEVSHRHKADLDAALGETYPHSAYLPSSGLAVYSAWPISVESAPQRGRAAFQGVVVQHGHSSLYLVNAHLARVGILSYFGPSHAPSLVASATRRSAQVTRIQETVREVGLPAVVACDCNMTDLTTAYSEMTTTLRDAHRERGGGLGHTFLVPRGLEIPSDLNVPVLRIDYLFHSPDLEVRRFEVIREPTGSDHLPILAQFELGMAPHRGP